jgi:hypothetical protein
VARFTIAYRRPPSAGSPEIEELDADDCRDVGDWIEFVRRDSGRFPTVLRVVHRSTVSSVLEVSEPTVVVHQLQDELTRAQAAVLVDELRTVAHGETIDVVDVRATGRFLSSVDGAALVARLDEELGGSGTSVRITALTTRREGVGRGWPSTSARVVEISDRRRAVEPD